MIFKINNPLDKCQLKFANNDKGEFEGYASTFNGVDAVKDTILPGAFEKTLKQKRAPSMFVNHDSWQVPVGDWVELSENDNGLLVKGRIDMNHRDGLTVYSALKRGAMDALSIGFRIPAGGAEEKEDGSRVIKEIDLKEISVVNFPADDDARISIVKTEIPEFKDLKNVEKFLRDAGFSHEAAKLFAGQFKSMILRDAKSEQHDEIAKLKKQLGMKGKTDKLVTLIDNLTL